MRKINFIVILLFSALIVIHAQTPKMFNYQASIRNGSGSLLNSQNISMRIKLLQGSSTGSQVYAETHNVTTTEQGIINIMIGSGNSSDEFESINWNAGPFFLKVEADISGGTNYIELGTTQLLSVPYALYADKAGSLTETNWLREGNNLFYNNGNIGIGTNNPISKLNIVGSIDDGDERSFIRLKNNSTGPKATVSIALQSFENKGVALGYSSSNYLMNDLTDFGSITTNGRGLAFVAYYGQIRFYTNKNPDNSYSEKMRINEDGNVGIGTTSPISKLNIVGNIDDGDERSFIRLKNNSTGPKATVSIALQSFDNKGVALGYSSSNYLVNDLSDFGSITTNGRGLAFVANYGQIRFYTNKNADNSYSEKMRINEDGNVGIGTIEPSAKLEIADGDIYIKDINKGIIMTSPDGQCWRGTINNSGVLEFVSTTCP